VPAEGALMAWLRLRADELAGAFIATGGEA
jgi:hypothetical protein